MHVTRETDYAVRCVYYLSGKGDGIAMIDEIAGQMRVPKSFLAKILQKLSKADIVRSYRGVKGGFRLARSPRAITLLDVIEAMQGPVYMNVCALDKRMCGLSRACAVHPVWVDVRAKVEEILRGRSFADLRQM